MQGLFYPMGEMRKFFFCSVETLVVSYGGAEYTTLKLLTAGM